MSKAYFTKLHTLTKIKKLEDLLFKYGHFVKAPCFVCGYNGQGYYNELVHPCAKRHNELYRGE